MSDAGQWQAMALPNPASSASDARQEGQQLLALVRSIENEYEEGRLEEKVSEACIILGHLIAEVSRQGLLRGDVQKAEEILASANVSYAGGGTPSHQEPLKKNRSRRRDGPKEQSLETKATESFNSSLIISATLRIFGMKNEILQSKFHLLLRMSADLCTAISEHIKSSSSHTYSLSARVIKAECVLMLSLGVPLLKGVARACKTSLCLVFPGLHELDTTQKSAILLGKHGGGNHDNVETLRSCIRAAASLVTLFGVKLSRSSRIVSDLRVIGFSALTCPQKKIQNAAAKLLAVVPLTGAMHEKQSTRNKTTGEQWNDFLMDSIVALSVVLTSLSPLSKRKSTESPSTRMHALTEFPLSEVISFFQVGLAGDERHRTLSFRVLIYGLSTLIVSLLKRDYRGPGNEALLMGARASVNAVLALSETMFAFPSACESLYSSTKKRLRREVVEGGVLSPMSLVSEVANYVKLMGHRIFNTFASALGVSQLLPKANRILHMVSACLISSTSLALRRVIDPTSVNFSSEGMTMRRLHSSLKSRTQALRTVTAVMSMFGLPPKRSKTPGAASWVSTSQSSGVEQCVTLVGGCLIEQLWWQGNQSEEWGSFDERVKLV